MAAHAQYSPWPDWLGAYAGTFARWLEADRGWRVEGPLTLARAEVPIPVALRLFLPEEWAADDERRMRAGVPEDVAFATKPKLGRAMLERAVAAGVPCAWVAADVHSSTGVSRSSCCSRRWAPSSPARWRRRQP